MKLLSHTEFIHRSGSLWYMDRPLTADRINAKKGLTITHGAKKLHLPAGIYKLDELISKTQ